MLACAGAEAIDRASRTKLGHFTSSTEIAVESRRRGEYGTLNGIERIFVEWKIRYSKIIDAQYRWCFPSMDFSKRLWRCRPFPSTIRRNNNRGCKWTRVEPAHETAQGHREQGASRATKCRMNNLSWRRSVHKLCARPTDYRYAHFR